MLSGIPCPVSAMDMHTWSSMKPLIFKFSAVRHGFYRVLQQVRKGLPQQDLVSIDMRQHLCTDRDINPQLNSL